MHRTSGTVASLDFLVPQSHIHFGRDSPAYSQTGWPRPSLNSNSSAYSRPVERRRELRFSPSPSASYTLPQVSSDCSIAPVKDGLRTPPADDMNSTAYHVTPYSAYEARQDSTFPPTVPHTSTTSSSLQYTGQHAKVSSTSNLSTMVTTSTQSFGAHTPQDASKASAASTDGALSRKSVILPNLQIPASINNSGGSLGEFAAQITCLFWFESTSTLRRAEEWTNASSPGKRLVPDAIPTVSFRKWVVTILSTTQVTQNVILLALLFIYRLKTLNPTVKGKAGSEYRLLTVALMLGNKFLDDNTYTNKTWAEVSGISVGEIHVMEVEFLSNMRYSLLASKEQWKEWQVKLGKFAEYFERASKVPMALPSPVTATHSALLPSPPTSMQASPPALAAYPSNSAAYNYNQQWSAQHIPPLISPLPSMPDLVPELSLRSANKKRGFDEVADEPPAKRITRSTASQAPSNSLVPSLRQQLPRLPVPNLSISTSQAMGYSTFSQNMPLLPPLSGRAMSTVYPTTPAWTPQPQMTLTPTVPTNHSASHSMNNTNFGTPSRRQSPRSVQDLLSMNSSPISGSFPNSAHDLNSPSYFLQQRASPYRPVRLPNTLLYPPPPASMHNFPTNVEQMHYQPLGKRNDFRAGVVPEFVPQATFQRWPALSQPKFNN